MTRKFEMPPLADGQADQAPDSSMASLAAFLEADTPDENGPEENEDTQDQAKAESEEGNSDEGNTGSDAKTDDEESEEDAPSQATQKFKVTVKGEDGADQTIEVDQKELTDGYLRRRDYTQKTTELAERERQAFTVVTQRIQEGRDHFMQQAALAHAAISQMAGLKSPEEMTRLAATDANAWVQEQARTGAVRELLGRIEQGMAQERDRAHAEQQDGLKKAFDASWVTLQEQGFDKPKLSQLYADVGKKYGFEPELFNKVFDARLVLMMRDAVAYQTLKDKKPEVQSKAQAKLPAQKQSVPKNERVNRELNKQYAKGRGSLKHLTAYLETNDL